MRNCWQNLVEGASLMCHNALYARCVCRRRLFERFSVELATVLIVDFISFISFVCQGPGNTCNTYIV